MKKQVKNKNQQSYISKAKKMKPWKKPEITLIKILALLTFLVLIYTTFFSPEEDNDGTLADIANAIMEFPLSHSNLDEERIRAIEIYLWGNSSLEVMMEDAEFADLWNMALEDITMIAESGNARAQSILAGRYFFEDRGVSENYAQAMYWWRRAAEQESEEAQRNIGTMYYHGFGVPQDYIQAAYWWRKAAEQGSKEAQNMVAEMYYLGRGMSQDYEQATYWWRLAAEQGDEIAQKNLGTMYSHGRGVPQSSSQAEYWWRMAAKQGNATIQSHLGSAYALGRAVPQSYAQAEYWWRRAAEQGDAQGQFNLGSLHLHIYGFPIAETQAYWFRMAAEQGHSSAQSMLGLVYQFGWAGASQNYIQAIIWYGKAAEQGCRLAIERIESLLNR